MVSEFFLTISIVSNKKHMPVIFTVPKQAFIYQKNTELNHFLPVPCIKTGTL
jgi:hypothetical protein